MADYEKFRSQSQAADLIECSVCGRKFMSESLQRHEPICAKTAEKKRKTFDSSKQRIEGTEIATVKVPAKAKAAVERELAPRKNNWRQKHAEFINTLHAARDVKKAMENGLPLPPPPPPVVNPDYVQCPTCNRNFSESAAQRHMTFCAEQSRRLPVKKEISQETVQRNAARTQYKPPKLKGKMQPGDLNRYQSAGPTLQNGGVRSTGSGKQTVGRTDASPARDGYAFNDQVDARKQYKPISATGKQQPTAGTYSNLYGASALPSSGSNESIGGGSTRSGGGSQRRPGIREPAKDIPSPSADGRPPLGPLLRVQQQQPTSGGYSTNSANRRMNSAGSGDSPTIGSSRRSGQQQQRGAMLSKFCHECGNRYCKETAVYCCDCGTKRIEL